MILRRDVGVGRTRLRTARAGGNEIERPQLPDDIAAHLLAEQLREFGARDWLKTADRGEHQVLGARPRREARSPIARWIASANGAGARTPAADDGDEVVGSTAQPGCPR
jgi:hypothetical protein